MKTTKRFFALFLSLALTLSMFTANLEKTAQAAETDTITVTLRVEDATKTLIPSTQITLTEQDVNSLNNIFNQPEQEPVLETGKITAAHALALYVSQTCDSPADELTFYYKNPLHIPGQDADNGYNWWSFRLNNITPTMEDGYTQYNLTECPIKNGDNIVIFRQDYDIATEKSTSYSFFEKESYEITTNDKLTVTLNQEIFDENWAPVITPASYETISVEEGTTAIKTSVTDENGSVVLSFDKAGTYTISAGDFPYTSRAYATIQVKEAASAVPAPVVTPSTTTVPSPTPTPSSTVQKNSSKKKPAAPKKLKAAVKNKKVRFSWKKVKSVNGYELAVSKKNKKKFKKLASVKKTKFTKKLKNGKYFVKVRSFKKENGRKIYSKYSKTITVRVK